MQRYIAIQNGNFDIGAETEALKSIDAGALVSFVGTVRDRSADTSLTALWLEHYPDMTEQEIGRIIDNAASRWPLSAVRVIHRIGRLAPKDNIVFVGVASAHRDAAFEAARFIMDYLKIAAPFWKAEESKAGKVWVDAKETDLQAMDRWTS